MEPESWVDHMADKAPSAVDALLALRADAEARLLSNEDYRTLVALDKAIREITGEAPAQVADTLQGPRKPRQPADVSVNGLSQPDAAHVLLSQVLHEPVVIQRLVSALNAHGIKVGGSNPNINLSSVLSKDGRFRSVRYKDRQSWWVKGTPFPGELDVQ